MSPRGLRDVQRTLEAPGELLRRRLGTAGYMVPDAIMHQPLLRKVTIKSTKKQDEMVRKMIRERARDREPFTSGRMCTNFVDDVVRALGIPSDPSWTVTPKHYVNELDKYLNEHPDRRGGRKGSPGD